MWLSMNSSMLNQDESIGMTAPLEKCLMQYYADKIQLAVVFQSEYEGQTKTVRGNTTYYPVNADLSRLDLNIQSWDDIKAKLLPVITEFQPDIIQCFGAEWSYGAIAKFVSVPVVIHLMGFLNIYIPTTDMVTGYCVCPAGSATSPMQLRLEDDLMDFERRIMLSNRYFMGRTQWDRNIVKYYSPGAKYYHVPEAIKSRIYDASGQWKYHYNGKLHLLTISSADYRKGNEIILRTAKILKDVINIDFEWRVAGSRDFFAFFEQRTGIHHQDVNINLLGRIDTRQIVEELTLTDFFIHPSIIDNSSNSICEAQLIGCPVLSSNVGGVAQLIEDGNTGFLYPYQEPHTLAFLIGDLYREEHLLTQISQNSVEVSRRRHAPKAVADALFCTYQSVIADWEGKASSQSNENQTTFPGHNDAPIFQRELSETRSECKDDSFAYEEQCSQLRRQLLKTLWERDSLNRQLAQAQMKYKEVQDAYNSISDAAFWKITRPLRSMVDTVNQIPGIGLTIKGIRSLKNNGFGYTWQKVKRKTGVTNQDVEISDEPLFTKEELELQRKKTFPRQIKFSIVVPLYNTPERFLREMIQSVLDQTYENWELCIADGSDSEHGNVERICRECVKVDSRIRYRKLDKNYGISGNINACLEIARGDYIGLLDHDDLLHPAALHEVMKVICEKDADFIYTDENTFHNTPSDAFCPHYKPAYAPDTLRANNYICHFTVFRRRLLEDVGLFRSECDGSQDFDMVLRLTEKTKKIIHIPEILYYWRAHDNSVADSVEAKPYVIQAAHKALEDHLLRMGLEGEVLDSVVPSMYRIKYAIKDEPLVSILIPNYEHMEDLKHCIESIENMSTYQNYEIVVMENNSVLRETFEYYDTIQRQWSNVRVIRWKGEFNFSAINNFGARQCAGDYLLLLNNDTEVISPNWIQEMLMFAQREDVGAVGAKLYYPDDTIQHGGVIIGILGVAGHAHRNFPRRDYGYMGRLIYAQNLSAVTAACIMIRRDVWTAVGGLDESFPEEFNDVDLCMRIRKAGYLIVWTPFAELYHYESRSREADDTLETRIRFEDAVCRFQKRWERELTDGDPYYNPNFMLDREDFSIEPVLKQHGGREV